MKESQSVLCVLVRGNPGFTVETAQRALSATAQQRSNVSNLLTTHSPLVTDELEVWMNIQEGQPPMSCFVLHIRFPLHPAPHVDCPLTSSPIACRLCSRGDRFKGGNEQSGSIQERVDFPRIHIFHEIKTKDHHSSVEEATPANQVGQGGGH